MNFSWRNLCDNCLRVHFTAAIHYSAKACAFKWGVYSHISLEKMWDLMKSMNKMVELCIDKSKLEKGFLLCLNPQLGYIYSTCFQDYYFY